MLCLYCDRPLALLKRLTGDAEFCSKEHRRIYQQEHNQLALARLLESKPKDKPKPRLEKPQRAPEPEIVEPEIVEPEIVEPEIVEPVKKPEAPQPGRAGFMPGFFAPGPMRLATRMDSGPRFGQGSPVGRGVDAKFRRVPNPKTAGFLGESSRPRAMSGAIRFQGAPTFRPKSASIGSAAPVIKSPQPARSRFLVERSTAKPSFGKARPAAGARFGTLTPVTAWVGEVPRNNGDSRLRMAKYLSGDAAARTASGGIRVPTVETRWRPLSPVLPVQLQGRIVLVLGALLQRPIRPASQDFSPETFAIPFEPVVFPQYAPQMACLEERLHRTDRIGFSPP
jgi:hypothetical protein